MKDVPQMMRALAIAAFVTVSTYIALRFTATKWDYEPLVAATSGASVLVGYFFLVLTEAWIARWTKRKDGRARPLGAMFALFVLMVLCFAVQRAAYALWRPVQVTWSDGQTSHSLARRPLESVQEHMQRVFEEIRATQPPK